MDEEIFQETLKRIRWSTNRDDLNSAVRSTLQLMLRRPTDQGLLNQLQAQANKITAGLPASASAKQSAEVRQAAIRCVVLLQNAKKGRFDRVDESERQAERKHHRILILIGATVSVAALYLVLMMPRGETASAGASSGAEIGKKVANALKTTRLGMTRQGDLTIKATHDHTTVSAERLAPEECLAAAKEVQSLGQLSINDNPVDRPTDEKLQKMCSEMNDASLAVTVTGYHK